MLTGLSALTIELLNLDINPMQMSRQPGIRQRFVRNLEPFFPELAVLQPQPFDFRKPLSACFVIDPAHLLQAVLGPLRRYVASGFLLNVQFFANGGVTPE